MPGTYSDQWCEKLWGWDLGHHFLKFPLGDSDLHPGWEPLCWVCSGLCRRRYSFSFKCFGARTRVLSRTGPRSPLVLLWDLSLAFSKEEAWIRSVVLTSRVGVWEVPDRKHMYSNYLEACSKITCLTWKVKCNPKLVLYSTKWNTHSSQGKTSSMDSCLWVTFLNAEKLQKRWL